MIEDKRNPAGSIPRNETNDAMSAARQLCMQLLTRDLRTKKEKDAAIFRLIERAASTERLDEIGLAMIHAELVSNPHLYRQLDNGNWILRENDHPSSAGNSRSRRAKPAKQQSATILQLVTQGHEPSSEDKTDENKNSADHALSEFDSKPKG